jgi:hypothetical protein
VTPATIRERGDGSTGEGAEGGWGWRRPPVLLPSAEHSWAGRRRRPWQLYTYVEVDLLM